MRKLHILRPGEFTDARGARVSLSESDLRDIAEGYDPAAHEAPLVIGHPASNKPAWGWVESLDAARGGLFAAPKDVAAEFADAVNAKRFKKISVSLYGPKNPRNPNPGKWSLRHVGFLGAQPPAVAGLQDAVFAEGDEPDLTAEVELREAATGWTWRSISDAFRRVREFIIDEHDLETADRVLPDYGIDEIDRAAARAEEDERRKREENPTMSEPNEPTAAEREAALAQREAAIEARERQASEREAQRRRQDAADFAERIVSEGRLPPRLKDTGSGVLTLLEDIDGETVSFSDGEATTEVAPAKALRDLLSALPEQVDFRERSGGPLPDPSRRPPGFAAPAGYAVDEGSADLHRRALDLSEREGIDYETAVIRVSRTAG